LFGASDEEGEKKSEAGTAKGEEKVHEEPAAMEVKEELVKPESPPVDTVLQRSSTGGAWAAISSLSLPALPFWSSNSNSNSAVPVHRIPGTDPATIPTPLTPKAAPIPIQDDSISAPEITFHCDICQDTEPEVDVAIIDPCGHRFGRDCLKGFISSRLADGKFPIVCPTCATGDGDGPPGVISSWLAESVGMTEEEYQRWTQLELAAYSFALECTQ
jgi:hypothetical protein